LRCRYTRACSTSSVKDAAVASSNGPAFLGRIWAGASPAVMAPGVSAAGARPPHPPGNRAHQVQGGADHEVHDDPELGAAHKGAVKAHNGRAPAQCQHGDLLLDVLDLVQGGVQVEHLDRTGALLRPVQAGGSARPTDAWGLVRRQLAAAGAASRRVGCTYPR